MPYRLRSPNSTFEFHSLGGIWCEWGPSKIGSIYFAQFDKFHNCLLHELFVQCNFLNRKSLRKYFLAVKYTQITSNTFTMFQLFLNNIICPNIKSYNGISMDVLASIFLSGNLIHDMVMLFFHQKCHCIVLYF
jgi:hypothetical protein